MQEVILSDAVFKKISELGDYLTIELKVFEDAALKRVDRMSDFLKSLAKIRVFRKKSAVLYP